MTYTSITAQLSPLAAASTGMLTTFRRSGQPVATPVSITIDSDHVYFATAVDSGKAKRLASNDAVTLAPCTTTGTVTGPAVTGRARPLGAADRRQQRRMLRPTRPLFWSYLLYRLRGMSMRVYEVAPTP